MKILANDGLSPEGINALINAGYTVITDNVPQDGLIEYINRENIEILLVRSATKVRKNVFDNCPGLRFVGRGGVGMDNIDVEYGESKGVKIMNTPGASSISVAELVLAHCFSLARFLHQSNRQMPRNGSSKFKELKKKYEAGIELRGKTIGIIGMGRIGQQVARYALGCGMRVMFFDRTTTHVILPLEIYGTEPVSASVHGTDLSTLLKEADFISLHVPAQPNGAAIIGPEQIALMKESAFIINTARGGSVDEGALAAALKNGTIAGAALDVFNNEPAPDAELLTIDSLSLSPHIGAATMEAQDRIGLELAEIIIREMSAVGK